MQPSEFDAGADPTRNAVSAGRVCERLATIQCSGETACCKAPGRDYATCKLAVFSSCSSDAMVDAIAADKVAAFDAERAKEVLDELERLSSTCDPSIKAFAESSQGLFSMFRGTVAAGGSCKPPLIWDLAMAAAGLASCANIDEVACLPSVSGAWTCVPHASLGGRCFITVNCTVGLFCDNPDFDIKGSTCTPRKPSGATCIHSNECESVFCRGNQCVPATTEVAYCPKP